MRYFLLVVPVLLCTAQTGDLDVDSVNWVASAVNLPGLSNKSQAKNNEIDSGFNLQPSTATKTSCTTSDGKAGRCVKPSFCTKPQPTIDTSTLIELRDGGCSHHLVQCCPLDQVKEQPKPPRQLPQGCGWSNPGGYGLRSSAEGIANFGEFPWMIALLNKTQNTGWRTELYLGGGTLIHPSVVVTVAHKVVNKNVTEMKCRAGEWDTQTLNEIHPYQERDVKKILIHEKFSQLRAHFDIALVILESPFEVANAPHIGVACLGRDMPAPGTLCYSMGWGRDFNKNNQYAVTLKKVQLPMVDPATCQSQMRNTVLGSNYFLHHTLTCAGGQGADTCTDDGGSSLVCTVQKKGEATRYITYGMVAYGIGCGKENVPGVYAKIPALVQWVDQMMNNEKLEKTGYVY